eukprot:TRINITY_DN6092_c1_g1_i1.p1 TRINITY_DN6092_c1_g1~~TRINITY_DN6092_c1_g1_i1.p1  ORF type:complete len:471 (+),score=154.46 TRINITY_DN6092_c1_g1_i1:81-1415(+)
MGCGSSCSDRKNVRKIFVSRYRPGPADSDPTDDDGDDAQQLLQQQQQQQQSVLQVTCPACGARLPGPPYCFMTGMRHTLFMPVCVNEDAEERADRIYLMGIYDSPTLLQELLSYVGHGTNLEVSGPCEKPSRLFWLSAAQVPRAGPSAQSPELLWRGKRGKVEHVPLNEMASLVLGKKGCSGCLVQNYRSTSPEQQDTYLRSFRVVFEKKAYEDIEVTAASVQEFEAWVISLSHVTLVPPRWGELMDISESPLIGALDLFERDVCATHCIPPALYLQVALLLRRKRDGVREAIKWTPPDGDLLSVQADVASDSPRVQAMKAGIAPPRLDARTGALYVTKGELRYWTRCDIFRTCAMWCLLERKGVVYDPRFRWACPPMELAAEWRWSPCRFHTASRHFRSTVRALVQAQRLPPAGSVLAGRGCNQWRLPEELLWVVCDFLPRFP